MNLTKKDDLRKITFFLLTVLVIVKGKLKKKHKLLAIIIKIELLKFWLRSRSNFLFISGLFLCSFKLIPLSIAFRMVNKPGIVNGSDFVLYRTILEKTLTTSGKYN
jgi:hypothetical protein